MAQTLGDLVNALFEKHSPAAALDGLHQQLSHVLENQALIIANQELAQADLCAIKSFLGITDQNPSEAQQVIDAQTEALKSISSDLQSVLPKEN